jgi:hypothetical protein
MKLRIIFIIIAICFSTFGCDFNKEFRKSNSCKGIMTRKYVAPHSHGSLAFTVKTDSLVFEEFADIYGNSYAWTEIGDSIIKPADTLMIIIKKNDSTYKEFFYRL